MEFRERILVFLTFFVCTASLTLFTASLATHRWIVAHPVRTVPLNASILTTIITGEPDASSDRELPKKFRGFIYFGLFQGTKVLNYGLGDRTAIIWVKQEMSRKPSLMTFSLWLLTILSVSIAMIFGLVGAIFSIINTVMTPVETITGVQGLHLWNGLAALFGACAIISWLVQYRTRLSSNVLTEDEQRDGWTSEGRASLGYSYYLVWVALVLHLFNLILVANATRPHSRRPDRSAIDKHPEGVIMLY